MIKYNKRTIKLELCIEHKSLNSRFYITNKLHVYCYYGTVRFVRTERSFVFISFIDLAMSVCKVTKTLLSIDEL